MAADDISLAKRMTVAISAREAQVRKGQHEEGTVFTIGRIDAGKLRLPSGRICISDAYSADEFPPLNRIAPEGEYSVELVIAELPKGLRFGGHRCAFVVVTFLDDDIATWQPVTAVKVADPCFTEQAPNRFVQEGATGVFSPEAGAIHFAVLHQDFDEHLEFIRKQARSFGINDWINYQPSGDAPNLIICEGGMGDGDFECFAGLTKSDRLARVVVDFGIGEAHADK